MPAKKPAAKTTKTAQRSSARSARRPTTSGSATSEAVVTIDRRRGARRDKKSDEATAASTTSPTTAPSTAPAPAAALERRKKVQRRRQIDPTTCERDYSVEEVEFMNSMDEYKRTSGRMFPTCSEVLEVIRGLGYVKLSPSERTLLGLDQSCSAEEKLDAMNDVVDALLDETL